MRRKIGEITSKSPSEAVFPSLKALVDWVGEVPAYGKRKKTGTVYYLNVPASFDIETSSFRDSNNHKAACMYIWMLSINGGVIYGRTWDEWMQTVSELCRIYDLGPDRRLLLFVRNLEFEFQFIRKWFEWSQVFAISNRHPAYAVATCGIEFRCSYVLSGESLASSGKNLHTYPVRKLVGNLDYSKARHSWTPLTPEELDYCFNDVRVDVAYIQEKMDEVGGMITRLQLTKTGYVRKYVRDRCMYTGSHKKNSWKALAYQARMARLTLEPDEYRLNKRGFQGGFTHTSARLSGTVQPMTDSWDITSSYPTAMLAYKYPMSKGEQVLITSRAQFEDLLLKYCCVFDVEFEGLAIRPEAPDCPISRSKCWDVQGSCVENNGRIALCDHLRTTITDVDFAIYKQFYTWTRMRVGTFYRYMRGYLPKEIIEAVLDLYEAKTTLKDVIGREQEYMKAKANINSVYGMIVTDICRPEQVYDGDHWEDPKPADIEEGIQKYNEDKRRFLFYPWGIFVTAYARMRLFRAIWACGERRFYYADTDSVKLIHGDEMRPFFEKENADILRRLEKMCRYYKIDPARLRPKNNKGEEKPLGVWDYEGRYKLKCLRAKAYMVQTDDGKFNITVSGVNKKTAVPYLIQTYKDPFEAFNDGLVIPAGASGKLTHTYLDDDQEGILTDYLGVPKLYHEKSAIHMEGASYEMDILAQYIDYLRGYQEIVKKE